MQFLLCPPLPKKCHPERSAAESKSLRLSCCCSFFFVHHYPKSVILSEAQRSRRTCIHARTTQTLRPISPNPFLRSNPESIHSHPKNKSQKSGIFLARKTHHPTHHVSPATHHKITTKNHQETRTFSPQPPSKKPRQTCLNYPQAHRKKNHRKSACCEGTGSAKSCSTSSVVSLISAS